MLPPNARLDKTPKTGIRRKVGWDRRRKVRWNRVSSSWWIGVDKAEERQHDFEWQQTDVLDAEGLDEAEFEDEKKKAFFVACEAWNRRDKGNRHRIKLPANWCSQF